MSIPNGRPVPVSTVRSSLDRLDSNRMVPVFGDGTYWFDTSVFGEWLASVRLSLIQGQGRK